MRFVRYAVVALLIVSAVVATSAFAFRRQVEKVPRRAAPSSNVDDIARVHEKWRVEFQAKFVGLPATDQAGVVVTVGESEVVAISNTGAIEWRTAVAGAVANAPRLDDGLVFVAAKRSVVALKRVDGSIAWSVPTTATDEANRANRPVVAGDVVVATAANGLVLGLDRMTGTERWRVSLPTATTAEPAAGGGVGVPPVAVVVGIAEWWGLDPATGATLWSGDIGLFGTSSPAVYASGADSLAAIATNERLVAVNARTGEPAWETAAQQSELYQVPVLADHGNELLVPDHWGRLTAYDPYDGRRFWSVKGADSVAEFGEPVLIADRLVALPLDAGGPRLGTPHGSTRIKPPSDGHGVADLPLRGLVITTQGGETNYVLLYKISWQVA
jgi:outer membrane protein assembly factor BamB